MGRIIRTISKEATVMCSAIDGRDIVAEIEKIHKTSAVCTAALGRLAMGTSLLGFGLKGDKDMINVSIDGGGAAGELVCIADSKGNVKACIQNAVVEMPLNSNGKLDVGGAVGTDGVLRVIKDLGLKEPYQSEVPIVSGEIAEDITSYLAHSEQIPCVCALGVLVNPDLTVKQAGGYLIQLLPFAPEEVIDVIEKNIAQMQSVTSMLESGMTTEEIAMKALEGLEPEVMDAFDVSYKCSCSRERAERMLGTLPAKDLAEISKDKTTEINCHFCGKKYRFSSQDIMGILHDKNCEE